MFRIQSSFSKLNGKITADTQADRDKLIFWKSENFCFRYCNIHLLAAVGKRRGKRGRESETGMKERFSAVFFISPESP